MEAAGPGFPAIRYSGILEYRMVRTRLDRNRSLGRGRRRGSRRAPRGWDHGGSSPRRMGDAQDSPQPDAVLDVTIDDRTFPLWTQVVSYCTGQTAGRLVGRSAPPGEALPLLVADRITAEARASSPTPAGRGSTAVASFTSAPSGVHVDQPYRRPNVGRPRPPALPSRADPGSPSPTG